MLRQYSLVVERIAEVVIFIGATVIIGPIIADAFDSIYLFRLSATRMAFITALSVVISPFYLAGLIIILFVCRKGSNRALRASLVLPAALIAITGNAFSNWADPLVYCTTVILMLVSLGLAIVWKIPDK